MTAVAERVGMPAQLESLELGLSTQRPGCFHHSTVMRRQGPERKLFETPDGSVEHAVVVGALGGVLGHILGHPHCSIIVPMEHLDVGLRTPVHYPTNLLDADGPSSGLGGLGELFGANE